MESFLLSDPRLASLGQNNTWRKQGPLPVDESQRESSDETGTQCIHITHILATEIVTSFHCSPQGIYLVADIDGMITKTSNHPVFIEANDTVEWDEEVFLPSERLSVLSFKIYSSSEIGSQILGNDELLCECNTTVGGLLDRNGRLQLRVSKDGEASSPYSLLRVTLERRVCDVNHYASVASDSQQSMISAPETRFGLPKAVSSLFNRPNYSNKDPLNAKARARIFALIVAIDKYKSEKNTDLAGCRRDGERFKKFLTGLFGVPSSQIVFLDDEYATRDAILSHFKKHFIENTNIGKGDAMVFFFAGHGSRIEAPPGWVSEGNKIEAICPYDEKTTTADGEQIYPILDRTISGLMRRLASEKGDNIIAIFDCCFSGGASRNGTSSLRARSTPAPSQPLPPNLDREIWESAPGTSIRGAYSTISESHILLAACRPNEQAFGDSSGGLFTSALLKALENCTLHDTTYARLFEELRIKKDIQHPQCLGGNKDRMLFSISTIRHGETTFRVFRRHDRLYVSAGIIHGVVVGTEFIVKITVSYETKAFILKVVEVGTFECLLERCRHPNFTGLASASVSNWNHPVLRVHSSVHQTCPHFIVVPADEQADITVRQNGSEWEFERFDPLTLAYSSRCITVTAETRPMFDAPIIIANFNSYLYRSDRTGGNFAEEIKVRLSRTKNDGGEISPVGEDLLDVPSSWHAGMEVKEATITDFDVEYCLTIENYSDVDLFPYLFYFDPSDYAIQEWYIPLSPTMDPPLRRSEGNGKPSLFAYGYGGFGTEPIEFYLPEGRTTDSGFLKIFLTNTYVDMSTITQTSIDKMRWSFSPKTRMRTSQGIWGCKTLVLTCKAS